MLNLSQTHPKTDYDRYNWTPPEGENVWHLPGFVEAGVTYESHQFWVAFDVWDRKPDNWKTKARPDAVLYVKHGGGVESIAIRHMFARQLRDIFVSGTTDTVGAFFLCWGIFELARYAAANERRITADRFIRAFANGQMKKRKIPGRMGAQVWLETPDNMQNGKFLGPKHTVAFDHTA